MEKISVLLVDDQKLFVDNLRTVLELTTGDIVVVGVAYDGREALEMIERLKPQIVIMDVRMPVLDGVEATRIIRENRWEVRILVLTTFDTDEYVTDAITAGADGYLVKNIPPEELFAAIRAVRGGSVLISPEIARRMAADVDAVSVHEAVGAVDLDVAATGFAKLSTREREIVDYIALAYSNREIADRMFIAEQTVKNYISRVYQKIGVTRRSQLMMVFHEIRKRR